MKSRVFLWSLVYLTLSLGQPVLSDQAVSLLELQTEISQLKGEFKSMLVRQEDLNSKIDLLLRAFTKDEYLTKLLGNGNGIQDDGREQKTTQLITERLDEMERILTEAPEEIGPQIFFGTNGGGIKAFSDAFQDIRTVISNAEDLTGAAYDPINDVLYYCSYVSIYRTDRHGTFVEIVLNDNIGQYGSLYALALDFVTGNLYVASRGGYILVCSTAIAGPLNCTTIVNSRDGLSGLALSPNEGKMYWTTIAGSIMEARMDGSAVTVLVNGLKYPAQILVDYETSRLYWADNDGHRIQSSNLAGGDIRTVVQLPVTAGPWGLALHGNKLYWGNFDSKTLQSSSKTGENVRTLYTAAKPVRQLTLATRNITRSRRNQCEDAHCTGICVIVGTAFRCLP